MHRAHPARAAVLSVLSCLVLASLSFLSAPALAKPGALLDPDVRASHRAHEIRNACAPRSAHAAIAGRLARSCGSHAEVTHPSRPVPASVAPRPARAATPAQSRAAVTAATIAAVLATPCQNTELTPEASNLPLVRAAVLCLINLERAKHEESPLSINPRLERAAEEHSQELIAQNYFAHVSPGGVTPVDRIRAAGYIPGPSFGYVIGENLAWGTLSLSTPQAIVSAWIASPGHLANILEKQYKDTGIAVVAAVPASLGGGAQGATYAQEFGVILA